MREVTVEKPVLFEYNETMLHEVIISFLNKLLKITIVMERYEKHHLHETMYKALDNRCPV